MYVKYHKKCILLTSLIAGCLMTNACGKSDTLLFSADTSEERMDQSDSLPVSNTSEAIVPLEGTLEGGGIALEEKQEMVWVHVCGAVVNPGVYSLPAGSRVEAALILAGGFTEDACISYINLAAKVKDGEKIYFPTLTEGENLEMNADTASEQNEKTVVNINTADAELLSSLPGIGYSRAEDIIAYRRQNGNFKRIEDIMQVSGIKESVFQKIKDRITV